METPKFKLGDTVIIDSRFGGKAVSKVSRVTKTRAVVNGSQYNIFTGRNVGSGAWGATYIRIPMEGQVEVIQALNRRRELFRKFSDMKTWGSVDLRTMEAIDAMIAKPKEESK